MESATSENAVEAKFAEFLFYEVGCIRGGCFGAAYP